MKAASVCPSFITFASAYSTKWTAACLHQPTVFFSSVSLLQGGLLYIDRQMLVQHTHDLRIWLSAAERGCQEMSSLEMQIVMQKPSLHAGRPSDTVGCVSGVLFVL